MSHVKIKIRISTYIPSLVARRIVAAGRSEAPLYHSQAGFMQWGHYISTCDVYIFLLMWITLTTLDWSLGIPWCFFRRLIPKRVIWCTTWTFVGWVVEDFYGAFWTPAVKLLYSETPHLCRNISCKSFVRQNNVQHELTATYKTQALTHPSLFTVSQIREVDPRIQIYHSDP